MRFVSIKVVTPPAGVPVSVDEFVDHARLNGVTVAKQPELLDRELAAATRRAERFLRRAILTQTLQALYVPNGDGSDDSSRLLILPRGNVQSVTSITTSGAALDPAAYRVEWNAVLLQSAPYGPAIAEYVAGYGDTGAAVPDLVREGILEYATMLYCDRMGERPAKYAASAGQGLPMGIRDLWRSEQIELSG